MATFWEKLFGGGKKDEPAAKQTNNRSSQTARPKSQPVSSSAQRSGQTAPAAPARPRGGQTLRSGATTVAATRAPGVAAAANLLSAPSRQEEPEEETPTRTPSVYEEQVAERHDELRSKGIEPSGNGISDWFKELVADSSAEAARKEAAGEGRRRHGRVPAPGVSFGVETQSARNNPARARELEAERLFDNSWNGEFGTKDANTMNARQRAALEFNGALKQAIEADLALEGQEGNDEYNSRVSALFGEQGGSDTYAPNVVAFLERAGISDTERGDLDNYLSGAAYITDDQLDRLGQEDPGFKENDPLDTHLQLVDDRMTALLTETLAAGQTILDNLRQSNEQLYGRYVPDEALIQDPNLLAEMDALKEALIGGQYGDDVISTWVGGMQEDYGVSGEQLGAHLDRLLAGDEARLLQEGIPGPDYRAIRAKLFK